MVWSEEVHRARVQAPHGLLPRSHVLRAAQSQPGSGLVPLVVGCAALIVRQPAVRQWLHTRLKGRFSTLMRRVRPTASQRAGQAAILRQRGQQEQASAATARVCMEDDWALGRCCT